MKKLLLGTFTLLSFGYSQAMQSQSAMQSQANAMNYKYDGITVLHVACLENEYEHAEFFLKNYADPNLPLEHDQIPGGHYPLHIAAINKNDALQTLLIKYGANPALKNELGLTADDIQKNVKNYGRFRKEFSSFIKKK